MGLMTGQHPSIPYPAPTSSMPVEALVAQGAGSPALCPLAAAYDTRLLGAPTVSTYAQHRFNIADLYGSGPGPYPDSAVAAAAAAAAAAGYVAGIAPSHPAAMLYPASLAAYDIKDPRTAWATLPQATGYPCDPTFAAYGAYGDRFDPVDSEARRRNATRETTSTLKAWLNEHRKNPYPTKGEKIMLAIITKMTLTQVSTWFANARRRLKKENKMTWEPRNKTNDDLDDVSVEDDDEDDEKKEDVDDDVNIETEKKNEESRDSTENRKNGNDNQTCSEKLEQRRLSLDEKDSQRESPNERTSPKGTTPSDIIRTPEKNGSFTDISTSEKSSDSTSSPATTKPKIWSLAQTAISESPPLSRRNLPPSMSIPEDVENRLRMSRLLYHDRILQSDLKSSQFLHQGNPRDTDAHTRVMMHQDSSADSSLSSPPLWRNNEQQMLTSEKFGRLTPYDSSDLRSLPSSSSSGSPAIVVSSSFDGQHVVSQAGLSYSHARFLGCRLLPYAQDSGRNPSPLPLVTADRYHHHPGSSLGPNLDLRTLQPSFMRPTPYGCPVSFTSASPSQTVSELRR